MNDGLLLKRIAKVLQILLSTSFGNNWPRLSTSNCQTYVIGRANALRIIVLPVSWREPGNKSPLPWGTTLRWQAIWPPAC